MTTELLKLVVGQCDVHKDYKQIAFHIFQFSASCQQRRLRKILGKVLQFLAWGGKQKNNHCSNSVQKICSIFLQKKALLFQGKGNRNCILKVLVVTYCTWQPIPINLSPSLLELRPKQFTFSHLGGKTFQSAGGETKVKGTDANSMKWEEIQKMYLPSMVLGLLITFGGQEQL